MTFLYLTRYEILSAFTAGKHVGNELTFDDLNFSGSQVLAQPSYRFLHALNLRLCSSNPRVMFLVSVQNFTLLSMIVA